MRVINVLNVCEALPEGIKHLRNFGQKETSRNGNVIVSPFPVTTIYSQPTQRVLFSAVRDANPFFHLMEAMWMLGGRNQAKPLNLYIQDFGQRFAESDGVIHDAYGKRWRSAFGMDQLQEIVKMLQKDPLSRQAVLQMWDCTAMKDLTGHWKTRPCNTHAYFRVNAGQLDMTVCCRSNDIIFGAYGANVVHFSILQEFIAAQIDVTVGRYFQMSNNFHMYDSLWEKMKSATAVDNRYYTDKLIPQDLVDKPDVFMDELEWLLQGSTIWKPCRNKFLSDTAYHMHQAMIYYRQNKHEQAVSCAERISAPDWRVACIEWLMRRVK